MYSNAYIKSEEKKHLFNNVRGLMCKEGIKAVVSEFNERYLFTFEIKMPNQLFRSSYNFSKQGSKIKIVIEEDTIQDAINLFVGCFKEFIPITITFDKNQYELFNRATKSELVDNIISSRIGCLALLYEGGSGWK